MNMNSTLINTSVTPVYDRNGAIIYTIVTLLFYSLSLFCSLILNIDPNDHDYEKKWRVYQNSQNKKTFHSGQVDILNTLLDKSLRKKYWQIYYKDDQLKSGSVKFLTAEFKRLCAVSKRIKELTNEQIKQTSKHQELDELNRIITNISQQQQPSPDLSTSSFLLRFRRSRSTSVPGVQDSDCLIERRSSDIFCQRISRKPPTITITQCS